MEMCPNCGVELVLNIYIDEKFNIEPQNYNKKTKEWYSPREIFSVKKKELKKRIDFLLKSWAERVLVYDEQMKLISKYEGKIRT